MDILFVQYPKCSTCRKAKKWLEENKIQFSNRHIVEENPKFEELKIWIRKSGLPIKNFFNTSGKIYREKNLKTILPNLNESEMISVLSSNGMLVKRPIIVNDSKVLVGFKKEQWEETLL